MKKVLSRIAAITLVLAMVAGFAPITKESSAKDSDPIKEIFVGSAKKNKLNDMSIGEKMKIDASIKFKAGTSETMKRKLKTLKYVSKNNSVATVSKTGEVTAISAGTTKIVITPSNKDLSNAKLKVRITVTSNYDMVFKYSSLYFVVPEGTTFPVTVNRGDKDAQGSEFDIKTENFTPTFLDIVFISNKNKVAKIDSTSSTLQLNGYGEAEIDAEYKHDRDVGDTLYVYVMTQAEFDEGKASGDITPEPENNFDEDPDDDPEDDPNEVIDTDDSEDE